MRSPAPLPSSATTQEGTAMTRHRKRRQWGSGEIHQISSGWQVRWRENGLRRARGGFATREDAERVLAKIRGDMAQHRAGLPPDPRGLPTLAELVPDILDRRKLTHRAADCDRYRWKKHIEPHFGHLKPTTVDVARIRAFVEVKLAEKLNPATIRIFVALLSAVFVDLTERGLATGNPARGLPKSLMRLIRSTHDPKKTPFIERLDDVRRIFLALPEPLNVAYAIGALAGLRTGEVFALRWTHLDLAARRIHVRESVNGPLKDGDSRIVPVLDALLRFSPSGNSSPAVPAGSSRRCAATERRSTRRRRATTSASRSGSSSSPSQASAGTKARGTRS